MKATIKYFIILLVCHTLCSSVVQAQDYSPNSFSVTVDGKKWGYNVIGGLAVLDSKTGVLDIMGESNESNERIILRLVPHGNYYINGFIENSYYPNPQNAILNGYELVLGYIQKNNGMQSSWLNSWQYSEEGEVKITEISNTRVKGTFYFDAFKINEKGSLINPIKK